MSIATSDAKEQSDKGAFGGGKVPLVGVCAGALARASYGRPLFHLSYGRRLFKDFV